MTVASQPQSISQRITGLRTGLNDLLANFRKKKMFEAGLTTNQYSWLFPFVSSGTRESSATIKKMVALGNKALEKKLSFMKHAKAWSPDNLNGRVLPFLEGQHDFVIHLTLPTIDSISKVYFTQVKRDEVFQRNMSYLARKSTPVLGGLVDFFITRSHGDSPYTYEEAILHRYVSFLNYLCRKKGVPFYLSLEATLYSFEEDKSAEMLIQGMSNKSVAVRRAVKTPVERYAKIRIIPIMYAAVTGIQGITGVGEERFRNFVAALQDYQERNALPRLPDDYDFLGRYFRTEHLWSPENYYSPESRLALRTSRAGQYDTITTWEGAFLHINSILKVLETLTRVTQYGSTGFNIEDSGITS